MLTFSSFGKASRKPQEDLATKLLQLPSYILDAIFDRLEVLDRCTLALASKQLLIYAQQNEHLDYIMTGPPTLGSLQTFFQKQLGAGWIPNNLRYCPDCGKFVSTDQVALAPHKREIHQRAYRPDITTMEGQKRGFMAATLG